MFLGGSRSNIELQGVRFLQGSRVEVELGRSGLKTDWIPLMKK